MPAEAVLDIPSGKQAEPVTQAEPSAWDRLQVLTNDLQEAHDAAEKATSAVKDAETTFKSRPDIAALYETRTEANRRKKDLESTARTLLHQHYRDTGNSDLDTVHYEISIDERSVQITNETEVIAWLIDNAPAAAKQLLSINTEKFNEFWASAKNLTVPGLAPFAEMPVKTDPVIKTRINWSKLHTPSPVQEERQKIVRRDAQTILDLDFVVLDTETTGVGDDRQPVQIGIISKDGEVLLDTLVKPTIEIDPEATKIHGITEETLKDAPSFRKIVTRFNDVVRGRVVVGYNVEFDTGAIKNIADKVGGQELALGPDRRDVMLLYSTLVGKPGRFGDDYKRQSLDGACKHFGIGGASHSALSDATRTLKVLKVLAEG